MHVVLHFEPQFSIFGFLVDYLPVLVLQYHRFELLDLFLDSLLMKVHILVDRALGVDDCATQESLYFAEELSGLMFELLVAGSNLVLVVRIDRHHFLVRLLQRV